MFTGLALVVEYAKYITFIEAYKAYRNRSKIELKAFGGLFVALLTISLSASISSMLSTLSINDSTATAQYRSELQAFDTKIQYADSDIAAAQRTVDTRTEFADNIQSLINQNNEMIAGYIGRSEYQNRAIPLQQKTQDLINQLSEAEQGVSQAMVALREAQDVKSGIVAEKASLTPPAQDILSTTALQIQEVIGIRPVTTTLFLTALVAMIFEAGLLVFGYIKSRAEWKEDIQEVIVQKSQPQPELKVEPQISFQAREMTDLKKHAETAYAVVEGQIPAGPSGMSKAMGIGRGTAQEIVKVLSSFGIVRKDENGHYQPVMPRDQLELLLAV